MSPGYKPQLDTLRAFAMTGVLYVHFWNEDPALEGVRVGLFFVLSGYLITRMLVRAKGAGAWRNVRNFYARRLLRLQPALLVMLGGAVILNVDHVRATLLWHVFQLTNVLYLIERAWTPWITAHLWSLNVVEQFYAFWPLVVLFLPARAIWAAAALMIIAGIAYGMSDFANSDPTGITRDLFPVAGFDAIGIGAVVALIEWRRPETLRPLAATWVGVAALCVLLSPLALGRNAWSSQAYEICSQLSLAAIVAGAAFGYQGALKRVLELPPLLYLGRISYGVYIYHLLLLDLAFRLVPDLSLEPGPSRFFTVSAATIVTASLSWHFLEAPIARLKRAFPVATPSSAPVAKTRIAVSPDAA